MARLTRSRLENLLGQVKINKSTFSQLPYKITGKRARGPEAALYAQCKWAHDVLEEMLYEHCVPLEERPNGRITGEPGSPPPRQPRTPQTRTRPR